MGWTIGLQALLPVHGQRLMSSTAVANGGAIAAGSTFAALQSVGAVGVSAVWSFAGAAAGAAGAAVGLLRRK